MSKSTTPEDADLRENIKRSGLYLEWQEKTSVPPSEQDRWLDVIMSNFFKERDRAVEGARIEENESIQKVLKIEIETGRDFCYNHEKYVAQCYACQTAKWTKIIAKMYLKSIEERLAQLTHTNTKGEVENE